MRNRNRRMLAACAALTLLTSVLSGCLAVAAAAGTGATVLYVKGDLQARVDAEPRDVSTAASAAVRDMGLHVISESSTAVDGRVVARTAADKKVTVTVKGTDANASTLSIRVGIFGDEQLSAAIYERIKTRLATRGVERRAPGAAGAGARI